MKRLWWPWLGAAAVIALSAASFVLAVEMWAALYPRSPGLARAAAWPLVGDWIGEVRRRHLPLPASPRVVHAGPPPAAGPGARPATGMVRPPELGPADLPPGVWPQLWLTPGDRLRASPADAASPLADVTVIANVAVLEARGPWRRVRWRGHEGWVRERPLVGPPLGSAPDPVLPVPARPPDPALMATARSVLGLAPDAEPARLGPYLLLTDVEEPALRMLLARAASGVERAWVDRYGLPLVGSPAEAIVVFRRRESYDDYVRQSGGPQSDTGHVASGVVALYREGRLLEEVRATLVHELIHLLNRRGVGPALPAWLDEGMADDLALSRFGPAGEPLPGTLSEVTLRQGLRFETHGGAASHALLREQLATGRLLPLADLLALDHDSFHYAPPRGLTYAQSSFFIRYLLASSLAERFREFLRQTAAGEPPTPEALQATLATPWVELDAGLAAFVSGMAGLETRATASPPPSTATP